MAGFSSFNPTALSAYNFNNVMQQVAEFYRDSAKGLGIDLYWCRRDFTRFGEAFIPDNLPPVPHAYRFHGELLPLQVNDNTNALQSADIQVLRDLRLRASSPYASPENTRLYQTFYHSTLNAEYFIKQSRDENLEQFVKLVLFDRIGYIDVKQENANGGTILLMGDNAWTEPNQDPEKEGSRINVVAMAEEGVTVGLEPWRHYTSTEFINQLVWSISHELCHLLIGPVHYDVPNWLMTQKNPAPHENLWVKGCKKKRIGASFRETTTGRTVIPNAHRDVTKPHVPLQGLCDRGLRAGP